MDFRMTIGKACDGTRNPRRYGLHQVGYELIVEQLCIRLSLPTQRLLIWVDGRMISKKQRVLQETNGADRNKPCRIV
jgi:hypothetical protein